MQMTADVLLRQREKSSRHFRDNVFNLPIIWNFGFFAKLFLALLNKQTQCVNNCLHLSFIWQPCQRPSRVFDKALLPCRRSTRQEPNLFELVFARQAEIKGPSPLAHPQRKCRKKEIKKRRKKAYEKLTHERCLSCTKMGLWNENEIELNQLQ